MAGAGTCGQAAVRPGGVSVAYRSVDEANIDVSMSTHDE
jgi:hypothetical protein